jgi:hypothetical protein
MREVATIAQEFMNQVETIPGIAKVQFVTHFDLDDLQRVTRVPLLLVSSHLMYLSYARHRQRGTQLMFITSLLDRNQRGERDATTALGLMTVLDSLDALVVSNNFGLDIQPFDIYRRETVEVEKGWSVIRTIYSTLIYRDLTTSKFEYLDSTGGLQTVEFPMISTSFQTEKEMDNNDYARVLDGTLKSYSQAAKLRYELRFTLISAALKEQFRQMKEAQTELTYYRDKDVGTTIACFWINDFDFYEERPGRWTGSMVLYES